MPAGHGGHQLKVPETHKGNTMISINMQPKTDHTVCHAGQALLASKDHNILQGCDGGSAGQTV